MPQAIVIAGGLGDAGPLATGIAVLILVVAALVAIVVAQRAWRGPPGQPPDPVHRAAVDGALVALGALAIVDNVVFHWLLEFHRFKDGWPGSIYVEVVLVVIGVGMVIVGGRGLRQRVARSPASR